MEFEQLNKPILNEKNFHYEDLKTIRFFAKSLIDEMRTLVKAVVIFGSNAQVETAKQGSDLDIMIVLDNVNTFVTPELREAYRIIVEKLINDCKNNEIHLMTINFSDYFDMARKGDPVLINILRSGVVIFDTNLIGPMQYLLQIGKIKPTRETIFNYQSRAEVLLNETTKHIEEAIMDLYYATVDIIHSCLILNKIIPPSPKEMPEIFKKTFKNSEFEKYSKTIEKLYKISKDLEHKKIKEITGKLYDELKIEVSDLILNLQKYNLNEIKKKDIFDL
jgi:predicted nucleotidyltransferase